MKNLDSQKSIILRTFILCLLLFVPFSALAEKSEEKAAIDAAEHFLQLIDSGQYQESWQQTAPFFQSQVSQKQWADQLQNVQPLFGAAEKRAIKSARHATSLPGAPDGKYFVLQFDTVFVKKKGALETVTMSQIDEQWQVAGYFIR